MIGFVLRNWLPILIALAVIGSAVAAKVWHGGQVAALKAEVRREVEEEWARRVAAEKVKREVEKRQAEDAIRAIEKDRLEWQQAFEQLKEDAEDELTEALAAHNDELDRPIPDRVLAPLRKIGSRP